MTRDDTWLIRGVTIPGSLPGSALGNGEQVTSILLGGGSVAAIGPELDHPGAKTLDADGLIALPGLVDLHTHLREPGREDAETVETGTAAAALGGYTAVHAMANTDPVADTAGVVEQVANGVTVRMAVLYLLLGGSEPAIGTKRTDGE